MIHAGYADPRLMGSLPRPTTQLWVRKCAALWSIKWEENPRYHVRQKILLGDFLSSLCLGEGGKSLEIFYSGGMRPIFCGNVEYNARQSELERLFRRYGKVDRVDMKSGKPRKSWFYVLFLT
ncbi:hypothetical protein H5410_058624 [Solanum commersonii]|uniref:RRM domain-containing protein n=1 Tax=Solanum commersonii TaxID=4109 RepID=A0A9J5WS36_SOLCO|nr:hypothetical protein H5410_058624 [Solanum commersonii]